MNEKQEIEIEAALNATLHSHEPSQALLRRLRVAGQESTRRRRHWWQSRFALVGTGAAGLAIAAMVLMPTKAVAKTYEGIVTAAGKVNAFQFSVETTDDHGKRERFSIAGADGMARMMTDDGTLLQVSHGKLEIYEPKDNTVTRFDYGDFVNDEVILEAIKAGLAEGLKQIDLKQMLKDYEAKYGKDRIRIDPVITEDGQNVYHVFLTDREQNDRVEMTVDASTDLPIRLDIEERSPTRAWKKETVMRMRFGSEVDASALDGGIPKSAKIVDMNLGSLMSKAIQEGADRIKDEVTHSKP